MCVIKYVYSPIGFHSGLKLLTLEHHSKLSTTVKVRWNMRFEGFFPLNRYFSLNLNFAPWNVVFNARNEWDINSSEKGRNASASFLFASKENHNRQKPVGSFFEQWHSTFTRYQIKSPYPHNTPQNCHEMAYLNDVNKQGWYCTKWNTIISHPIIHFISRQLTDRLRPDDKWETWPTSALVVSTRIMLLGK